MNQILAFERRCVICVPTAGQRRGKCSSSWCFPGGRLRSAPCRPWSTCGRPRLSKSRNITPLALKIRAFLLMQHVKVKLKKKNEIRIKQWTSTLAFLYRTQAFWRWDSTLQMGQKCAFSQKMSPPPQTMVLDCCAIHLCFSLWVSAHQQKSPFFLFLPFYF